MELKIKLTINEYDDLVSYCKLNDLDQDKIVKKSYKEGFNIERYGLLNSKKEVKEKIVEKEIIKYVEVPKIEEREVIKIEYVEIEKPIEKIIEVVKEVPVDKVVEKVVEIVKEVPVDRVVIQEVIKEIPVEKVVEREVFVTDNKEVNELLSRIQELENKPPKIVEVVKEIPVEKVVIQEKVVEIVKEVPVEKIIEKPTTNIDNNKVDALQKTLMKLRQEIIEKDLQIKKFEQTIQDIQNINEKKAVYLRGSNLDDKLYK